MEFRRKWVVLLALAATAWPAMAAKSISIQQFEQMLFADQGKSDEKVADRIDDVALTERVTPARLARWEKQFPGSHTREVLLRLADESAFMEPPVDDVLKDPAPDVETQQKMMAVALDYVKTEMKQLPNFYATRTTMHYQDSPTLLTEPGPPPMALARAMRVPGFLNGRFDPKPMQSTGTTKMTVTYRDGHEVRDTDMANGRKESRPTTGFTTSGEFGPILGVVIGDALRGQVTWARWEQGASDPIAIFNYSVPEDRSNYGVGVPKDGKFEDVFPAYHGEIALDPATGAIFRLSVVADLAPPNEAKETGMMVEYAPVEIGSRTYTCPVHGVAYSKGRVEDLKPTPGNTAVLMQTQLNDVTFTEYHLFRTETRIVGDANGKGDPSPAGAAEPGGTAPQN